MNMQMHCRLRTLLPLLALLALAASLQAGLIATNEYVPASITTYAGTENDPAVFVYDNYTKNWGTTAIVVGSGVAARWIQYRVQNGSVVSNTTGTANNYIGIFNASNNQVVVTGAGSRFVSGRETRLGDSGCYNKLTVTDHGVFTAVTGEFDLGGRSGIAKGASNFNSILIDNATFEYFGAKFIMGYTPDATSNTITVTNGGKLNTLGGGSFTVGRGGAYGDVTVAGYDSVWTASGTLSLSAGLTNANHNTLTILDSGLVKGTTMTSVTTGTTAPGGNYVRFAAGFLAMNGDRTAAGLVNSKVQVWDGAEWIAGVKNSGDVDKWTATFYSADASGEAAAFAATGYSGLAGYTVFTGGKSIAAALKTTLVVIQ